MTRKIRWGVAPVAVMMTLSVAVAAFGRPVDTPLRSPLEVTGESGGNQDTACGFRSNQPNQVINVTEDFTSLEFVLEAGGQPTLYITGTNGFEQCVFADDLSGGRIEIPGVWEQGSYSIYVGDRAGSGPNHRHNFTLTVTQ